MTTIEQISLTAEEFDELFGQNETVEQQHEAQYPEPGSDAHRNLLHRALGNMKAWGKIRSAHTPDGEITATGKIRPSWYNTNWWSIARTTGVQSPVIVTMRKPDEPGEADEQQLTLKALRTGLGLEPLGMVTSGITFAFCLGADRPGTELPFAPKDITVPEHEQGQSRSGLRFNPASPAGKTNKRMKPELGFAERTALVLEALDPSVEIPAGDERLKVHVVKTLNASGDGQGLITLRAANLLLKSTEGRDNEPSHLANSLRRAVALQVKVLGTTDFKAVLIPTATADMPKEWRQYDIVVDEECIKYDVSTSKFTAVTVNVFRSKPSLKAVKVDALMQIHPLLDVVNTNELLSEMRRLSQTSELRDLEDLHHKIRRHQEMPPRKGVEYGDMSDTARWLLDTLTSTSEPHEERNEDDEDPWAHFYARDASETGLAHMGLLANGMHPSANPVAAKVTTGRTAAYLEAALTPKKLRKAGMPYIVVSGERVKAMHHRFAGVPKPRPGYLRLVWDRTFPDQIAGECENPDDYPEIAAKLDTLDKDGDDVTIILLKNKRQYHALLLRAPMSVGGGHIARLTREDGRKMEQNGYHAYSMTGTELRHNYMYQIGQDGEMEHPSVIKAGSIPKDELPRWSTRPGEMYEVLRKLTLYNRNIGVGTNISFTLHASGQWDPQKHWSNISEELIDPSHNGTADTNVVREAYLESLLEIALSGISLESRFFERKCRRMLLRYYRDLEEDRTGTIPYDFPRPIQTHLDPDYEAIAANSGELVRIAKRSLCVRQLMSNGPLEGLLEESGPEATHYAMQAYASRIEAWSLWGRVESDIDALEEERVLKPRTAKQLREENLTEAMDKTRAAAQEAYEEYNETCDVVPGDMAKALRRLHLMAQKRWGKEEQFYASLSQVSALPDSELYAAHIGTAAYTILTRLSGTLNNMQLELGESYLVAWSSLNKPGLFKDGKIVDHLGHEAESYLWKGQPKWHFQATYRGPMPQETGAMDLRQTTDTIHVFEVTTTPVTPAAPEITVEENWAQLVEKGGITPQGSLLFPANGDL
jgi:hypothetical protein